MGISSFVLENGMQFYVSEEHSLPAVSMGLFVRAGSCDEPDDYRGIAHFFEHMMFKGAENTLPGEYAETIDKLGGSCNAYTSRDATVFHALIPTRDLETLFKLESDRFKHITIDDDLLETEKRVIREEYNLHYSSSSAKSLQSISTALIPHHPYCLTPLGSKEGIQSINSDSLRDFHKHYYTPETTFAVIVGDVSMENVTALAETYFSDWQSNNQSIASSPPPLTFTPGHKRLRLPEEAPYAARIYPIPPAKELDAPAFSILKRMLGWGETNVFTEQLVHTRKTCVFAGTEIYSELQGGVVVCFGAFLPPISYATIHNQLEEVLDDMLGHDIDSTLFKRSKKSIRHSKSMQACDRSWQMNSIGRHILTHGGVTGYENELVEIAETTPERVLNLATRIFDDNNVFELNAVPESMKWWMWPVGVVKRMVRV